MLRPAALIEHLRHAEAIALALRCVAQIAARFDVIVIDQSAGDTVASGEILRALGQERWGALGSDPRSPTGSQTTFVYDRTRVVPSGLASELIVLPGEGAVAWDTFARQFVATPYAASFLACGKPCILLTANLHYAGDEGRQGEIEAVARWLANWARDEQAVGHNLLLLGDFDASRRGDPTYDAFASTGLHVPEELHPKERARNVPERRDSYDAQIAWFTNEDGGSQLGFDYRSAGAYDFTGPLCGESGLARSSDRFKGKLPLWVEFGLS